jgi:beta-galactosidase
MTLRNLIGSYLPKGKKLPPIPDPVPTLEISAVSMLPFTAVWDNLPKPVTSARPETFESLNQFNGFILYKTELTGQKSGKLIVTDIHDYATVFLNGSYIGKLDRREGVNSIEIPVSDVEAPVLEILTEAMGHINFGSNIIDRKGITDSVTLDGTTLINWKIYSIPMDKKYIYDLRSSGKSIRKPGIFFKGNFVLTRAEGNIGCDSYVDFSNFTKGIIWVNGHNLGRYWNIGPQKRLYCPSTWMREGLNEIIIFDLHETATKVTKGYKTLN